VVHTYLDPAACQDVREQFGDAALNGDGSTAKQVAADYRTTIFNADGGLRAIEFPAETTDDVNDLLQADKDEITALDAFATVSDDAMLDQYAAIMVQDDDRVVQIEVLDSDLGHYVDDHLLAIQTYDDPLRAAAFTLEGSFVELNDYSADLTKQEAAALVDADALTEFGQAVDQIPIAPPDQVSDDETALATAFQALVTTVKAAEQNVATDTAGKVHTGYVALANAVNTLDSDLGKAMTTASAPDHGCVATTG